MSQFFKHWLFCYLGHTERKHIEINVNSHYKPSLISYKRSEVKCLLLQFVIYPKKRTSRSSCALLSMGVAPRLKYGKILEQAMRPKARVKIESEVAAFGQHFGSIDINVTRDHGQTDPAVFE